MILTCPNCATRYQADEAKFVPSGRNVRCAKCGHTWHQSPPDAAPEPDLGVVAPQPPPPAPPAPEPVARNQDATPVAQPAPAPVEEPAAPPPWPRWAALVAGWVGLVLLVGLISWAFVRFRQDVASVWPRTASLYSAIGLEVNARGIAFTDVKYNQQIEDGAPVLAVTGKLVNISARELPVPEIRVALIDDEKRELYHWTFEPGVMTLRPGEVAPFMTRLASPPKAAHHLELRFAKAGE
jgi:predicted Zn finger-like uncharacterized protein